MDLNQQNTSTHSSLVDTYLEKKTLAKVEKSLFLYNMGKKQLLRRGMGKTVTWTLFDQLTADLTASALVEGVPPDGSSISSSQVTATMVQHGKYVSVTDIANATLITPLMEEAADQLGYWAALTMDTIARNEIDVNGTAQYADATSPKVNASVANVQADTAAVFSTDEIRVATAALRALDAPTFEDGLYRAVISATAERDLMAETAAGGFVPTIQYTSHQEIEKGLLKPMYGVKFYVSNNIRANDSPNTNVYKNLIFAKDSFGVVDIEGLGLKTFVAPMVPTVANPLAQFGTVGVKFATAAKTLRATWIRVVNSYGA